MAAGVCDSNLLILDVELVNFPHILFEGTLTVFARQGVAIALLQCVPSINSLVSTLTFSQQGLRQRRGGIDNLLKD